MHIDLTTPEQDLLKDLIAREVSNLGTEIRHTDTRDYREDLKERREDLRRLLERMREVDLPTT